MDKKDFNELVDLAMQQPGRGAMRPVVEKEILHYDIFYALDKAGLLKDLVFQGGTSLRLCRGSSRFSEDLDFAGGKEPKDMATSPDYDGVKVDKWQISVETAPQQRDLPRQKIKVEIANIPAHTRELLPLRLNYDFLQGSGAVLVNAESIDEVMADKIVAFPVAKNTRYRDIWDLAWLQQQGAKLDPALVIQKIDDYKIENYPALLSNAIIRLPELVNGKPFKDQMLRFIDSETIAKTLDNPLFLTYLIKTLHDLFGKMAEHLEDGGVRSENVTFKM